MLAKRWREHGDAEAALYEHSKVRPGGCRDGSDRDGPSARRDLRTN